MYLHDRQHRVTRKRTMNTEHETSTNEREREQQHVDTYQETVKEFMKT